MRLIDDGGEEASIDKIWRTEMRRYIRSRRSVGVRDSQPVARLAVRVNRSARSANAVATHLQRKICRLYECATGWRVLHPGPAPASFARHSSWHPACCPVRRTRRPRLCAAGNTSDVKGLEMMSRPRTRFLFDDHPRRRARLLHPGPLLAAVALAAASVVIGVRSAGATAACLVDTMDADDINANQKDLNEFC